MGHASWPMAGLTVTGLIVPLLSPFVAKHTSLVCGAKERQPFGAFGGVWGVAVQGMRRRVSTGSNEGAGTYGQQ